MVIFHLRVMDDRRPAVPLATASSILCRYERFLHEHGGFKQQFADCLSAVALLAALMLSVIIGFLQAEVPCDP